MVKRFDLDRLIDSKCDNLNVGAEEEIKEYFSYVDWRVSVKVIPLLFLFLQMSLFGVGCHSSQVDLKEEKQEEKQEKKTKFQEDESSKNKPKNRDEKKQHNKQTPDDKEDQTQEERVVPVEVIAVRRGQMSAVVSGVAIVEAKERATLRALTSGVITTLKVEEGDRVKPKQHLAQLTRPGASSLIQKASASYRQSKKDAIRLKTLSDKGLIPKEEWRQAQFQREQSRLEVQRLRQEAANEKITSPIHGVIAQRSVYRGESVSPGQVLFEVIDLRTLRIPLFIPDQWSAQLKKGLSVRLHDRRGQLLSNNAILSYVSPIVDAQSGTIKVFITPPKGITALKPGLYVGAEVILDTVEDTLILPKHTLMYKNNTPWVVVIQDDISKLVALQTGYTQGDFIEVKSPLQEGDLIVSFGQRGLEDGTRVKANLRTTPLQ